jgi:hypothetical protein
MPVRRKRMHTPSGRSVTGVHASGPQIPGKQLAIFIVRQTRAESKPFCSARGMEPRCCLCAMTFLASIP